MMHHRRVLGPLLGLAAFGFAGVRSAAAGYFELSANGSYLKQNLGLVGGVASTKIVQRYGAGFAYRFLSNTSIEISYTSSTDTDTFGQDYADLSSYLKVQKKLAVENTSIDLILDFAGKKSTFRPYIRGGGGYMERRTSFTGTQTDRITEVSTPLSSKEAPVYSVSANAGIGFKIFLIDSVAIDASYTVFATDLDKPEIFLHYSATGGLRFLF